MARTITQPTILRPRKVEPQVEIGVCMGTGGIAAGGKEVFKAFQEGLAASGVMEW